MPDKYSAVWVSHSSISDFFKCPQLYYYNQIYRNPKTGRKIQLMKPALALGQAVHEVLELLSMIPTEVRLERSLIERYESAWAKVSGSKGGFTSETQEREAKERGAEMLRKVMKHPGPLKAKAVKIKMDLPYFWLSEEEEIILCGKIDWLEYLPESNGVHIIDFKTGRSREKSESLQLPIYVLLALRCQPRPVEKISYWYLADKTSPEEMPYPNLEETESELLVQAKKIKLARKLQKFECQSGEKSCQYCGELRRISLGEGTLVGVSEFGQDIFMLDSEATGAELSEIL